MRSRWYGDNPGMQPKQGNHTPYRFVLTLQTFFSPYFLSYRTLTLGSMSWAGVSIFTCELFGLLVSLLYGALLQWTCSDTRHTTPSLSDFLHFPEDRWPTVTILITTFNETPSTLVPTITAACNIDWPSHKLCVYVCDDAPPQEDRTWLLKLLSKLKCTYIPYSPSAPRRCRTTTSPQRASRTSTRFSRHLSNRATTTQVAVAATSLRRTTASGTSRPTCR